MDIEEKHKNYLKLLNKNEKFSDEILDKLLENCSKALSSHTEVYDISSLSQDDTTEIKQLYASLLYVFAQFVRNSQSSEEFSNFLLTECDIEKDRAQLLEKYYEESYNSIRMQLLNIGNYLPHITDVRWKIDYMVKSSTWDQSEGPIFRVSLKTEKFDSTLKGPKIEFIEFSCTGQELQDLVYKLKDAVRHCQKLANNHNH
ncbi:unnamed protein product [Ceutorhynchus assimilis]|uniref:COMM domain-containing protein 3 n=1 Tax=Ceutorhynchus assimilis TaxID=467358 RepID=A0A9N9MXE5_9CUCU|nr:unnamed protein product [Ceutorhynchus assimilis]